MLTNRQAAIRERAYALWVESGHPDGRSDEYWLQAEHELETAMERFGAASHDAPADDAVGRARKAKAVSKATKTPAPTRAKARTRKAASAA